VTGLFKDREHYLRAAILLAAGVAAFLVFRTIMVPKGFGMYGHYREGALTDNRARALVFAGRSACEECHADVAELRMGSRHERVNCEACHGALAAHAVDPGAVTPKLPEGGSLCLTCHAQNVARPVSFPQVDPQDHAGNDPCTSCHRPHHPETS
jgi:hypothetical protein